MIIKKLTIRERKFLVLGILNLIFLMQMVTALTDIATCSALQGMNTNLGENYRLIRDVDCSSTNNFASIGDNNNPFRGSLDGQGYKIYGLHIDEYNQAYVGLIGYLGSNAKIKNLVLVVDMTQGKNYVGTLAGKSEGIIEN